MGKILPADGAGIARAAEIIGRGGVVAFPTETFYGLAADALNETALKKIFTIKGREEKKPLLLLVSGQDRLLLLVEEISPTARRLMDRFWPGPLTLVFAARQSLSPLVTGGTGKVGLRVSSHPVARALLGKVGRPITATSANLSGHPSIRLPGEVINSLDAVVDAVLDGGETAGGWGSTLLDVTCSPPKILRPGAIPEADLAPFLKGA
jgi:L-threonylcarbamoyladenylate synthase